MRIAVVGCGYVAELYAATLHHHPKLALLGAFDSDASQLRTFCERWKTRAYASADALLADPAVELVLVLTDPRSHFEINRRSLEAGKHVYSEKPLAMDPAGARQLVELARGKGVHLSSAPCSLLSETAQTLWKALDSGIVGKIRLVYANFEDGLIAPRQSPWLWKNAAGTPWPAKDEFEVGCTYEHAGYVLTWLAAFFGPARAVTSFASCQLPDKGIPVETMAPDFTVGCIEYDDSVVARLTCGLVAPHDKSLTIVGDRGTVSVTDLRDDAAPVYVRKIPAEGRAASVERRLNPLRRWLESILPGVPWSGRDWHFQTKYPFARRPEGRFADASKRVDFCRGPSELADAIRAGRACRLSAELGAHVVEVIHALQYPDPLGGRRALQTTFPAIEPLPWVR